MPQSVLRRWWEQDFYYSWLPVFLARRGLTDAIKTVVAIFCLIFGACGLLVLIGEREISTLGQVVTTISVSSSVIGAVRWKVAPWPTEVRSLIFLAWADTGLAVTLVFGIADHFVALSGGNLFVVIGMYVTLAHSPKVLVAHLSFAAGVCTYLFVQVLFGHIDSAVISTISRYVTQLVVIVSVPSTIGAALAYLKADARVSDYDPLTNLLNRRGVAAAARRLAEAIDRKGGSATSGQQITAVVIDLDGFKSLNDKRGHTAGDLMLTRIADRLVKLTPDGGFVGRLGGDEFTMVFASAPDETTAIVDMVRGALSADGRDGSITASAGVATMDHHDLGPDVDRMFGNLLDRADTAMYAAKRLGGNRVVVDSV